MISVTFDWRFGWWERLKILLGKPVSVIVEIAPEREPGRCRTVRREVAVWRLRPHCDERAMSAPSGE